MIYTFSFNKLQLCTKNNISLISLALSQKKIPYHKSLQNLYDSTSTTTIVCNLIFPTFIWTFLFPNVRKTFEQVVYFTIRRIKCNTVFTAKYLVISISLTRSFDTWRCKISIRSINFSTFFLLINNKWTKKW